jgi:hypothetical protein
VATDKNMLSNKQVVNHLIIKNVECILEISLIFFINMKGPDRDPEPDS